ncbi:hypothetical protein TWF481_011095 [Arthrobotrys musiformis]|uniref:F-box domain-containing protein n=1 Tax=Arthrobotrys musiformis TaxID=47236 RepID=A0AAV9VYE5_9PEZI
MENTIPLHPELIFEVLRHTSVKSIWNFARTSRTSYLLAFRVLASRYKFPLSIPHAITSGFKRRHEEGGYFHIIDTVSIDVTEDTWTTTSLPHLLAYLSTRRSIPASANVKIHSSKHKYCSIDAVALLLKEVFVKFPDVVVGVCIDVEIAQMDEMLLVKRLKDLYRPVRSEMSVHNLQGVLPLTAVEILVKAQDPRNMANCFMVFIEHILNVGSGDKGINRLEDVKIVAKWRDYNSQNAVMTNSLHMDSLKSDSVRRVWIEDKNWNSVPNLAFEVLKAWPCTEALHLDLGLGSRLLDYSSILAKMGNLRELSIPFPYADSFTGDGGDCCMNSLFLKHMRTDPQSRAFTGGACSLREINFHYLRRDGLMTNRTKMDLKGTRVGDGSTGLLTDLGERPTDPTDLASMRELMLVPSLRRDDARWLITEKKVLVPFMSELAAGLMEAGDQLEHWKVPEDAVFDPDVNRCGVWCTQCACLA